MICRALRGAFQPRPSRQSGPCSFGGENRSLPLQKITWKLAMLLALGSAARNSDLVQLSVNHR